MIRRQTRRLQAVYAVSDVVTTIFALLAAYLIRFESIWPAPKGHQPISDYLTLLPVLVFVWPVVFYFHRLYQLRRDRSTIDESLAIVVAVSLSGLMLAGLLSFWRAFSFNRPLFLMFLALDVILVGLARFGIRKYLEEMWSHGIGLRRVLIAGAGELGKQLADKLLDHPASGMKPVGFADDDLGKRSFKYRDLPVLGTTKELRDVLERNQIDTVFLALPVSAYKTMLRILKDVGNEMVDLRVVPDLFQYVTFKAGVEDFDGLPVINLSQVPLDGWNSLVKRSMDIILSAGGLVALAILYPAIALAIWLEDHGPIFYTQERMGLDGRVFKIIKFRSMKVDAEEETGATWATEEDPRRTAVGGFLRKTSLDELPQLINVFRGDMSLVGPRPERPEFVKEFKEKFPQYMLRHRVRAGITGWAQIHGWRGNTSLSKRIEYDLYYIENWSLELDLKILWMTLRTGFWHRNAY
ncbi:MAG: undecaprenyl-phosphate glucose phosphotransferase [Acidobacteria bacterium]|nr:undecaprenyl-phosphate glucose phosphotransferase [Acidobacteriota bacterium]MCG3191187.1 UDP-glucose:undecaprenyl-phosphate glucose-1-phosphate transferase [Thermoanaerobaculia bacterium]MCK6681623.1 undecaprenyl-phosphate glucose phosphotransferase [Thermoanaerobaculia bacterium]